MNEVKNTSEASKYTLTDKLVKLLDIKSILTVSITYSVLKLGLNGSIEPDKLYEMGLIIMAFYFGAKSTKDK